MKAIRCIVIMNRICKQHAKFQGDAVTGFHSSGGLIVLEILHMEEWNPGLLN